MDRSIPQDDMVMIEAEDCDAWQMPEGLLLIGRLDPFAAQGFVDLLPNKSLPPRSRPAPGIVRQMAGKSVFRVFDGEQVKEEKELRTGDQISVPAGTPYSLENKTNEKCVLYWRFDGDVTEAFEKLKKSLPKIPFQAREKSGYKGLFESHQKRREDEDAKIQGEY